MSGKNCLQFDVWLIDLNPTKGSEVQKSRPCVIVSPNGMNNNLNTVIIAPLSHTNKNYPSRIPRPLRFLLLCYAKEENTQKERF